MGHPRLAVPGLPRPRSLTHVPSATAEDFAKTDNYEDILRTNIKLWKHSQAETYYDDDDVFEVCPNQCDIKIVIDCDVDVS